MPRLLLEPVPEELLQRLEQLAAADQVPLMEEVLRLLHDAIANRPTNGAAQAGAGSQTQREILDEIARNCYTPGPGMPDSTELLREDRDR